jgi:predicted nucleotidyltransferase
MKVMVKSDILKFLKENKETINSYGVSKIGLFGSFVKNTQKKESDIDILVEFNSKDLTYDNFINLAFFLEDNLSRKVDLITSDGLSPYIGPQIMEEVEYVSF